MRIWKNHHFLLRTRALVILTCALSCLTAGCNRNNRTVELDTRYSYNVVHAPDWFPDKGPRMRPAEQDVFQRYGRPNFIRIWWNPNGKFITGNDLSGKMLDIEDRMKAARQTWIYLGERDIEIEFKSSGGYLEHPVSEQLRLICENGDPTSKLAPKTDSGGHFKESWTWADVGLHVEFLDGHEIARSYYLPTGPTPK